MPILGYNVQGAVPITIAAGRMHVTSFTLQAAGQLNELHGFFGDSGTINGQARIVAYASDGAAGAPGTRLAYTSIFTWSGDQHLSESGFTVDLQPGTYWLGWAGIAAGTGTIPQVYSEATGGTHNGRNSGVSDPPDNPFGTVTTSGTRIYSVWAVVAGAPSQFVPKTRRVVYVG